MFQNLEIFRVAHAMASHAGARQSVVAGNIANADTPDYKTRDIADFQKTLESGNAFHVKTTREGHIAPSNMVGAHHSFIAADQSAMSPNGNSVSLESEMLKSVDVQRQHNRALAIYKSSLNVLRTSIGRG